MSISQPINITVDSVIFLKEQQHRFLLLIKRKNDPYKEFWALPGGFVDDDELVVNACHRELKEETGLNLDKNKFKFLGYYDQIGRDPRRRTITFAFTVEIDKRIDLKEGDDADDARWFNLKNLPKLAFDHLEIIEDAQKNINN